MIENNDEHDSHSIHLNVFEHESKILEMAETLPTEPLLTIEEIQTRYQFLTKEYKKLLRQTQKITRIGDSNQKKLLEAYNKIENQNLKLDRAIHEAESANAAKNQFLAKVSHEIRNPMNVILGMAELLHLTHLNNEQKSYISNLRVAGKKLLHVINDILDFSKIESGLLTLENIDFYISDTVKSIKESFITTANEKGIRLNIHTSGNVPLVIKGDNIRLSQILFNLMGNAIKFTDKGIISLDIRRINKENPDSDKKIILQFTVRDSGIGIASEKHSTIFESFIQADSSTTRRYGGTGLGLTICKQLVELMGGTIELKSQPGRGSTFSFNVPFAPGNPHIARRLRKQQNIPKYQGKPLNILLGEDNPMNAELMVRFLKKQKHRVTHAKHGKEILEFIQKRSFDVILMDVEMPEIDGFETTRRIRSDKTKKFRPDIPIIAITAHTLPVYKNKILSCGMNDIITKPIDFYRLSKLLFCIRSGCPPQKIEPGKSNELAILDSRTALKRLQGDTELYKKFCTMFIQEIPEMLKKIEIDIGNTNYDELRKDAHYLKNSAALIGTDRITELAERIEKIGSDKQNIKYAFQLFNQLKIECSTARKALK